MGTAAILIAVLEALPQIMAVLPSVGVGIRDLFDRHADELPDEVRARLKDAKAAQAAAESEWAADLPGPASTATPAAGPDDLTDVAATVIRQSAEIRRLRDDNQRLASQLAKEQAALPPGPPPGGYADDYDADGNE